MIKLYGFVRRRASEKQGEGTAQVDMQMQIRGQQRGTVSSGTKQHSLRTTHLDALDI